jgi:hypothetical protein
MMARLRGWVIGPLDGHARDRRPLPERFPAKWDRFAVRKRDNAKESRAHSDSNETEYALAACRTGVSICGFGASGLH